MLANVTKMRSDAVRAFRNMYAVNNACSWLQRAIECRWHDAYEASKARAATMKDHDVWRNANKQKAIIDATIGKDAMLMAIRAELAEDAANAAANANSANNEARDSDDQEPTRH